MFCFTVEFVWKSILHENECYKGTFQWYNSYIDQYMMLFPNAEDEHVEKNDPDRVKLTMEDFKTCRFDSYFFDLNFIPEKYE